MKKTLIALAVAGFVAAPAAMADVTVYGQGHVSVGQNDDGEEAIIAVTSNSSRIGFKAAESLDGGLTAVAQMEFGVAMDQGGGVTGRNQFVGLAGGFGTILAGRHDAPNKMSTGAMDVFADTVADYNAVIGYNGATDVRADNAIAYVAPAIGGATIVLAYVPDADPASTAADDGDDFAATSLAVMWAQGPLSVNFGYLNATDFETDNAAGGVLKNAALGAIADVTDMRIGVGYAVSDALKVGVIYNTVTADLLVPAADDDLETTAILANAAFSMGGGNTIKASYGMITDNSDDAIKTAVYGGTKTDATFMSVGLDHAFSKNVNGYVVYASLANDDNAIFSLGNVGSGANIQPAAGDTASALELGMVVKF